MCTGPKQDERTNMVRAVEWGFFGGQWSGFWGGQWRVDGLEPRELEKENVLEEDLPG